MGHKRKEIVKKVRQISEGILSKVVDLALVSAYFGLEFSTAGYGKGFRAVERIGEDLSKFNHESLKLAFSRLRRKGLIESVKNTLILPEITEEGKRRIKDIIPHYDKRRVWDKKIYMIIYDFPRKENNKRNIFRDFLKKIGCGMLQESVWITPYNPNELIKEFIESHNFYEDLIIVSSIGKDGTIGRMELPDLMERVYNLSNLNERYRDFLAETKNVSSDRTNLIFSYLVILSVDPQIPFELLPDEWMGDKAYEIFVRLSKHPRILTKYARA